MKKILFLFIFILTFIMQAEKIANLSELEKPTDILFYKGNIYIMDSASVLVFDSKNGKYKYKFARKGEGPGEIKISPFLTNTLTLHKGNIAIDSQDKIIFYSKDGKFLKDKKKGRFLALQVKPFEDFFIVKGVDRSDRKTEYITLSIYNNKIEKVKEIAKQKSNIQIGSVNLTPDSLHFTIKGDKVYVEKSTEGFMIEIYNKKGDLVNTIKHPSQKIPVTSKDKNYALNRYKNDPLVKQFGFEQLKSRNKFLYSNTFPEIQDILNDNNNLVIKTFLSKKNKIQYIILDENGKIKKKVFLPKTWEGEMISHLNGVEPKLYKFYNGYFYYLLENIEDEEYELHRTKI